jgi:diacylglycerol kinase (ATP)
MIEKKQSKRVPPLGRCDVSLRGLDFLKMLRSFRFAFWGLKWLISSENNARFHLLATIVVLLAGFYFKLSLSEWAIILTQIGLVWAAEAFNTAIEKLCDHVSPQRNETIGKIKDLASAGVLIVSVVAAVVGLIVFLPKLMTFISRF